MESNILSLEQADMEMDEVITQCIALLLNVLSARIEDDEDDREMALGAIRIISDPQGGVGERVAEKGADQKYAMFFACVPCEEDADELEYKLTQWAIDPEQIKMTIQSLQPAYNRGEFADDLDEAAERIAEVLYTATIIPKGSPVYELLHKSVARYC